MSCTPKVYTSEKKSNTDSAKHIVLEALGLQDLPVMAASEPATAGQEGAGSQQTEIWG